MTEKTHYRKAFNSPYLSSADIVGNANLTVSHVKLEKDKTKKTPDLFNTAYFVEKEIRPGEKLKPMILNAGNSKTMKELTGSPFIDDWQNVPVTVYVDPNVRFGRETVEGLRIKASHRATLETLEELEQQIEAMEELPDGASDFFAKHPINSLTEDQAKAILKRLKAA